MIGEIDSKLFVVSIDSGSEGDRANIHAQDIILSGEVKGEISLLKTHKDWDNWFKTVPEGEDVTLEIFRPENHYKYIILLHN